MCPNLKHLSLIGNTIGRIHNFFHLPLETLCLDKNVIQTLDNLPPTLKKLSVRQCSIRMIQSRLPPGIEHLNLFDNKLQYAGLPLNWGTSLKTLDLGFNQIQRFPKSLPDTVRSINLERNKLEAIPSQLPKSLVSLNLTRNRLFTLPNQSNISLALGAFNQNHLTKKVAPFWIKTALMEGNFNTNLHDSNQKKIRAVWKRYLLKKRLRIYGRTKILYSELIEVALSPEHILQTDVFSSEWNLAR
jgi:Leucine-rich repeat (LRR) protein